ncbi:hypothetical protein [Paraburkholderia sp. BL6669N2]|uniref:hypothetical protein n=1 Tax=Paraburkholderia sp. BL6669N2 TaxID=1938807 RepID=UPI0011C036D5|nr:hypothetical protein [Paraburkholderia sp. BL6669N2]
MFTGIVLEVKRVFNRAINPEARKARPPAWQSETRHPAAGSAACRRRTKAVHLHYCHVRSARLLFATHSKTTRPIHGCRAWPIHVQDCRRYEFRLGNTRCAVAPRRAEAFQTNFHN